MGVSKAIKKLRGLIVFGVLILAAVIVAVIMLKRDEVIQAPTVAAGQAVKDSEPNNTLAQPQNTGLSLNRKDWCSVEGKFDADNDIDRFIFDVAEGVNGYDIQTWIEVASRAGQPKELTVRTGILGVNDFPVTIVCYNKTNKILTNILLAGSLAGSNFPDGTTRVSVNISARKVKEGAGLYDSGREYKLYLKGRYKEPKKSKDEERK